MVTPISFFAVVLMEEKLLLVKILLIFWATRLPTKVNLQYNWKILDLDHIWVGLLPEKNSSIYFALAYKAFYVR